MKKTNILFVFALLTLTFFLISGSFASSVDLNSTDDAGDNFESNHFYNEINSANSLNGDVDDLNESGNDLNAYNYSLSNYFTYYDEDDSFQSNMSKNLNDQLPSMQISTRAQEPYASSEINQTTHIINGPDLNTSFTEFNYRLTNTNTFYVNSSFDGDEETGNITNPFRSLDTAISSLSTHRSVNTIYLCEGAYEISRKFSISKNFNLIGENALNTIIYGNNHQILSISGSSITVNIFNLTFSNGKSYYGGAIYSNMSSVNIVNSIFKDNLAEGTESYAGAGAAFYNEAGYFRVYNSSFINNKAYYTEVTCGGAIYNDLGTTTILYSEFIENGIYNSTYGSGASIYNFNGFLTVFNSSFINNTINSSCSIGGAISNFESNNVFVINSTFEENKLYGDYTFASAISNKGVLLELINSSFISNHAYGIGVENSTVYNLNGLYKVVDSIFENNTENVTENNMLMLLEDQMIVSQAFDDDLLIDLPLKYDLRKEGLVSSVKNQGSSGACWAFSALAALESYLLKYENITYDLSENNMKNVMGSYGLNGTDWTDGGNYQIALAYLLRWSGPVSESQDPFSSYSIVPNDDAEALKHVQGAVFIPVRLDYLDNAQIKYALMKYGALYTSIYGTSMTSAEYNSIPNIPDHAITIVGWDDNYSASRFRGVKPPGDGAFIIKNSWGSSYGESGYGYVSYYDKTFAGFGFDSISAMAFCDVENVSNYGSIYQYDSIGNTYESIGFNSNTAWMANQFVAESSSPLAAFGLYAYSVGDYWVDIYVNGELKYTQEGNLSYPGFHTVRLNEKVGLNEGDIFRINVKLTSYDSIFPIAIESMRPSYSSKADSELNQSFVSPDGVNWIDIGQDTKLFKFVSSAYNGTIKKANVCLKAYTENLGDLRFSINANTSYYFAGDIVKITFNVTNFGDYVSGISINVTMPNNTHIIKEQSTCSKGIYNSSVNLWTISGLAKGESAIVNMIVNMTENMESANIRGIVDASSNSLGLNQSTSFSLHYSPIVDFSLVEDKIILAKTYDFIEINLTNVLNESVAGENILLLIYNDSDLDDSGIGSLIANCTFISNENGTVYIPIGLLLNGSDSDAVFSLINSNLDDAGLYDGSSLDNYSTALNYLAGGNYTFCVQVESDKYDFSEFSFNLTVNKINTSFVSYLNNESLESYLNNGSLWSILNNGSLESYWYDDETVQYINLLSLSGDLFRAYLQDEFKNSMINKSILVNDGKLVHYQYLDDENDSIDLRLEFVKGAYKIELSFGGDDYYSPADLEFYVNVSRRVTNLVFDYENSLNYINCTEINNDFIDVGNVSINVSTNLSTNVSENLYGHVSENGFNVYNFYSLADLSLMIFGDDSPLSNEAVSFTIINQRNETDNLTVLSDKEGKLNLSGLCSGKYHILSEFSSNDIYEGSKLEFDIAVLRKDTKILASNMLTNSIVVAYDGRSGEYFNVTLEDSLGNKLVNKSIKIGFNGKVYNKTTDENGNARLQINLPNAFIYTFAIAFLGDDEYSASFVVAKITVNKKNMSLTVPNKSFKVSSKKKVLTATLKDYKGNLIANKILSFTINGKTYVGKTNSKGLVSVNVSLSKKGTYSFAVKFDGDNSFATVSKKGKVIVN